MCVHNYDSVDVIHSGECPACYADLEAKLAAAEKLAEKAEAERKEAALCVIRRKETILETREQRDAARAKLIEARVMVARIYDARYHEWREGENEEECWGRVCDSLANWGIDPGQVEHEPARRKLGLPCGEIG